MPGHESRCLVRALRLPALVGRVQPPRGGKAEAEGTETVLKIDHEAAREILHAAWTEVPAVTIRRGRGWRGVDIVLRRRGGTGSMTRSGARSTTSR